MTVRPAGSAIVLTVVLLAGQPLESAAGLF